MDICNHLHWTPQNYHHKYIPILRLQLRSMGLWVHVGLANQCKKHVLKSPFLIQTCDPLTRWWNLLSSSLMGSSAMGTLIASAWRRFEVIGSSKRTGWVGSSFGVEKSSASWICLESWGLWPKPCRNGLTSRIFSSANSYVMSAKLTKRPTCDEPYRLKGIRLMSSGISASNQEMFVPWPELYFVSTRGNFVWF